MSEHIYLFTLRIVFVTVVAIFAMRYLSAFHQAKAKLAYDEAYRKLAEKAAAAEVQTAASLAAIQASLAEVGSRVGAIEKVLKEVE